ncbi:MAG: excinuclease ABC subunit UvrC [Gammaproteobacteria bacterium]|nr:excinuclease ABC subunit UvrC [Gammaproteobacteria bacterium]MDH5594444.1 excinuclease ABC subunit UvrC [Gammaproteobacteria bacterium]
MTDCKFDAKAFVKTLPGKPGVYRMLDENGGVIYIGKARDLKKRVSSYFTRGSQGAKTKAMVRQICNINITITHTENEALILENNLIKESRPKYNILLRDDKSYPFIYLSGHDFPRLGLHRGTRKAKGRYFGPYPSAGAVRESLNLLQKLFPVRQCEDSYYKNRTRPCLQYQIKRCTAPCVGLVDKSGYADDVRHAVMFLEGKSHAVIDELVMKMERASDSQDYEAAACYRDQIASLKRVQEKQYVSGDDGDFDVVTCYVKNGIACVQVVFIRGGRHLGDKTFFPKLTLESTVQNVLGVFLAQYYLDKNKPPVILVNEPPENQTMLEQVLSEQENRSVIIKDKSRGDQARWVKMALTNTEHALLRYLANKTNILQRFEHLQDALKLANQPQRLECFDISHTMGEATVASCVVFDINGPVKDDYRRFNIEDITPGDDYAAMRQALSRRYKRLKNGEGKLPDMLVIDGGKGQISQAHSVLEELQINDVLILGVAKGPGRKPGLETLYLSGSGKPIILPADSPALHLIQQIRDEAHRFAITGHRQKRSRSRKTSSLESIPGLGPKRRQQLLNQFGGLQEVARAGVEDLANVKGISKQLAQKIYDVFH